MGPRRRGTYDARMARPAVPAALPPALQVLIVDDQAAVRRGLRCLLTVQLLLPAGQVREAATLNQARAALAAQRPGLLLLDVDLAGDDGLALLPLPPATTVVVLSSSAHEPGVRQRALKGGAAAVLPKAMSAPQLGRAIVSALGAAVPR